MVLDKEKQGLRADKKSLSSEDQELVAIIILGWSLIYNLLKKIRPEMYARKLLKAARFSKKDCRNTFNV